MLIYGFFLFSLCLLCDDSGKAGQSVDEGRVSNIFIPLDFKVRKNSKVKGAPVKAIVRWLITWDV